MAVLAAPSLMREAPISLFVLPPRTLCECAREVRTTSVLLRWRNQHLRAHNQRLWQQYKALLGTSVTAPPDDPSPAPR